MKLFSCFVVPSFVSTFATPVMSVSSLALNAANSMLGASCDISNAVQTSVLADQPLVVGPGFSLIPVKLVTQILARKFIELSNLLPANLQSKDPEKQLVLEGHLVLTSQPKKSRRRIANIVTWLEASIFSLVLLSHFLHRWKDLLQYQLLMLRTAHTHRHFSGRVWFAYDQAFCERAAKNKAHGLVLYEHAAF